MGRAPPPKSPPHPTREILYLLISFFCFYLKKPKTSQARGRGEGHRLRGGRFGGAPPPVAKGWGGSTPIWGGKGAQAGARLKHLRAEPPNPLPPR